MNLEIINIKSHTRDQALKEISEFALSKKITSNKQALFNAMIKREQLGTTGFEDGIAIPHARIDEVAQTTIIIARLEQGIDWPSLDNKKTNTIIALIVAGGEDAGHEHMELLALVAKKLMDSDAKTIFKTGTLTEIKTMLTNGENIVINEKKSQKRATPKKNVKIVAITSCATGVVHTFMAQKALLNVGEKLGYNVRVETQGQKGQDFTLTPQEIKEANVVIIGADINVELDRFVGKKVFMASTNDVINNPEQLIAKALKEGIVYSLNPDDGNFLANNNAKGIMKHILSGVSRMIPFIVFSGIVWAVLNSIGQAGIKNSELDLAIKSAKIGFTFFIAMMGGFIGESIGGRAAFAPAAIATFVASDPSFWFNWGGLIPVVHMLDRHGNEILNAAGKPIVLAVGWTIVGAIIWGFAGGHLVRYINSWKVPDIMKPLMPILFIPAVGTSLLVFPLVFVIGAPIGYIINMLGLGIGIGGQIPGVNFLIGFVLGAMIGFDMGGPVNKIAGATATALIQVDPRLLGAVEAAIPIAPLGAGLATLIGGSTFDKNEKGLGLTALALGFFGISEGAIPFAAKRPKITVFVNIISSALAGGFAFLFFVGGHVGMWGGPIVAFVLGVYADPGSIGTHIPAIFGGSIIYLSILWFFVAIAIGTIVHSTLYIYFIRKTNNGKRMFDFGKKQKAQKSPA